MKNTRCGGDEKEASIFKVAANRKILMYVGEHHKPKQGRPVSSMDGVTGVLRCRCSVLIVWHVTMRIHRSVVWSLIQVGRC
jgi:hypothetical protein